MNRTQCKFRLSRDALVKGLMNLIIPYYAVVELVTLPQFCRKNLGGSQGYSASSIRITHSQYLEDHVPIFHLQWCVYISTESL